MNYEHKNKNITVTERSSFEKQQQIKFFSSFLSQEHFASRLSGDILVHIIVDFKDLIIVNAQVRELSASCTATSDSNGSQWRKK